MVDGLSSLPFETEYVTKTSVRFAELKFLAFSEEMDRVYCGFFRRVELLVLQKQLSKVDQTPRLFLHITKSFENPRRFFRLTYPFLVEASHRFVSASRFNVQAIQ